MSAWRTALQMAGDDVSAGEVAGHWAAADRADEELPARMRAATTAERVLGYADAARHWQRAIELWAQVPKPERLAGVDLPQRIRAGSCRTGGQGSEAVPACSLMRRTAVSPTIPTRPWPPRSCCASRGRNTTGHRLMRFLCWSGRCACSNRCHRRSMRQRLGRPTPDSYSTMKVVETFGGLHSPAGWRFAEAVGATGVAADIQANLAHDACLRGDVAGGFALIERARR